MKKTYRKVKQWTNDHYDALCVTGSIALAAAGSAAVLAIATWSAKEIANQQKQVSDWTREQNFAGKTVYQLADGSYIAVSKEQVS
jgi:hypothetical protein